MLMSHTPIPIKQRFHFASGMKGVSLLIVVIILGSALLIMVLGAFIAGLAEREGGYALQEGGEAFSLADGCMNEVMLRIHRNAVYGIGSGIIPFTAPNGSCSIEVIDLGGGNRQIDVIASMNSFVKHIRVTGLVSGGALLVSSWEERSD